jgi:hypothetical protein
VTKLTPGLYFRATRGASGAQSHDYATVSQTSAFIGWVLESALGAQINVQQGPTVLSPIFDIIVVVPDRGIEELKRDYLFSNHCGFSKALGASTDPLSRMSCRARRAGYQYHRKSSFISFSPGEAFRVRAWLAGSCHSVRMPELALPSRAD